MKVLISFLLLLLLLMLMSMVSGNPNPGVNRSHKDKRQASGRWLQEGRQEYWFLRAPKRKLMAVPRLPKKQCPCDHLKGNMKRTRHRRQHRKPNKHSRACQQFIKRCQLASLAGPL
ncbi:C-X-C motif chemokine 17 isoform X2 [Saccopteryx bilineata]|uniref:C-X-C motif chemokine 17 isoform X2 n=1 Tax=Saccopteryx bilineata TaxID=59482 RepID=UPI0033904AC4